MSVAVYIYILHTMERRYLFLLVKTIKCFTRRRLEGSMICTTAFVRLLIRMLFDVMFCVERESNIFKIC